MFGKIKMIMGSGTIWGYFLQVLPFVCLVGIIYFAIRFILLKKSKAPIKWGQEIFKLLFVCYLSGLISLVILPANFWLFVYDGIFLGWWGELGQVFQIGDVNLVPSAIKWLNGELSIGSWVKTMLIGNIAMFIPFGFFFPLVSGIRSHKKLLLIFATTPFCVEILQLLFGRSLDVDDLICNFIGIVLGSAIAFGIVKIKSSSTNEQ